MKGLFRGRRLLVIVLLLLASFPASAYFWAEYHFRAAQKALTHDQPAAAREHLRQCLRVWPHSKPMHLLLARAARQQGDFAAAETLLYEYQFLETDRLSEDSVLEWAMLRASSGDLETVENYLRKRVEQHHPQTPSIHEALTAGYLRMYRILEAQKCLDDWIEHEPNSAAAHYLRGRLSFQVHLYKQAVSEFELALESDPAFDKAHIQLASALLKLEKAAEAAEHLEALHRRLPDHAEVSVLLARAFKALGRAGESQELLDAVLKESPHFAPALSVRGQLALESDHPDEAEPLLRQAGAADPADHQTQFLLYQCLTMQGRHAEAKAQHEHLQQLEKDILRLIDIAHREMSLRPQEPALHYELGTIMVRLGQEELGRRWFQSALQLDASYAPAQRALTAFAKRADSPFHHSGADGSR